MAASVVYQGAWQGQTYQGAWQNAVIPVAGAAVPIMSSNGIHSLIFGGQVITGCLIFAFIWSLTETILSGVIRWDALRKSRLAII